MKTWAVVLCVLSAPLLNAQGPCQQGEELRMPYEISADPQTHVLRVSLDVTLQKGRSVPVYNIANGQVTCFIKTFDLRNYGYPTPEGLVYGYPGPTLRLRKPLRSDLRGDALKVTLTNHLDKITAAESCNDGCPKNDKTICDGSANQPLCCASTDTMPNCFHGDNATNLHFHGLHVSPQSPQDYVLLDLLPYGSSSSIHATHGKSGLTAVGSFDYAVNPLQWDQPEGTFWYHPHKHGATALQVANGMAGALIVEGQFDDTLNEYFLTGRNSKGVKERIPKEKILVMQQIHSLNFNEPGNNLTFGTRPLINGQLVPQITMMPGEVQRWRMIAATIDASAQLTIDFNGPSNNGVKVGQIAMDGIQFDPKNYQQQPLIPDPTNLQFNISPGNRADFLVRAPETEGKYTLTYAIFGAVEGENRAVAPKASAGAKQKVRSRANITTILKALGAPPGLLTINVQKCSDPDPTACTDPMKLGPMEFPSTLPPMPDFLKNIPAEEAAQHKRKVNFFIDQVPPPTLPTLLGIQLDGKDVQTFNPDCASFTLPLGQAEEWTLTQNKDNPGNQPLHVFHIHTNAFQVVQNGLNSKGDKVVYDPPIWMDSITIPDISLPLGKSAVVMRTRFSDYTGQTVMHCHFLGHEDRGMMLTAQFVCPDDLTHYGAVDPNGGPDNCKAVNLPKAIPDCGVAKKK